MIKARKLGHIMLKVRDAAKSRDFYTRTLGLKVAHEDLGRGAVFLSFGEPHHDLAPFQLATGEAAEATQPGSRPSPSLTSRPSSEPTGRTGTARPAPAESCDAEGHESGGLRWG